MKRKILEINGANQRERERERERESLPRGICEAKQLFHRGK